MKITQKSLWIFAVILVGLLIFSSLWLKRDARSEWREYARKAYFDECKKQIDKDHGKWAIDAVRLSDELKDCEIVASERW